ncbi:MYCBP-associated protein-like [Haliotis asinina]|uniref:MYCBP-associated protein-like n=1 Tax=Haliotis asinina TaxID=109174 RepID=UPI003531D82B
MSERRKTRAQSIFKGLGVPSNNDSGMGAKRKSLSRVSSSVSQSDTGRGKGRRRKDAHMEEAEGAALAEQLKKAEREQMLAKLKAFPALEKLREEMVRQEAKREKKEKVINFTVKKKNPNYRRRVTVAVAVPAPGDVKALPLTLPVRKGPRVDKSGRVVPHSILGSVAGYSAEAQRRGETNVVTSQKPLVRFTSQAPKVIPAHKSHVIKPRHIPNVDEIHALQYWRNMLDDRERQRANIVAMTGRDPSEVIMGEARTYSKWRVLRREGTVDGILHTGTRGTGFWALPDFLGEKDVGIFTSLTRTERGYARETEFMSVPEAIQQEKGYIKTNRIKLDPILSVPKLRDIYTIGRPFNATTKVKCEPQPRLNAPPPASREPIKKDRARSLPSLIFGGHIVTWSDDVIDETVVKAELGLDCFAGDRQDAHLEVTNTGLTVVAFDWKKLPTEDPFGFKKDAVQRFYFDQSYGIILPGETKRIATSFKSPGPGVYTETWGFETSPRLCGRGRVLLTLWGIARDRDVNKHGRDTIEKRLSHNQALSICQRIIHEVIESMTLLTPFERCRRQKSYTWMFEDAPRVNDHFEALNPGFFYHSEVVRDLLLLNPETGQEESASDSSSSTEIVPILSLASLKKNLETLSEDDKTRNGLLHKFSQSVNKMTFSVQRPVSSEGFSVCRCLWSMTIDDLVTRSLRLRDTLGISSESNMPEVMVSRIKGISKVIKGRRKTLSQTPTEEKPAPVSSQNRRKSQPAKSLAEETVVVKPQEQIQPVKHDPLRYKRYKEKLHCEIYDLLCDLVDRMSEYLSSLDTPRTRVIQT